jgi:hypothetical protein
LNLNGSRFWDVKKYLDHAESLLLPIYHPSTYLRLNFIDKRLCIISRKLNLSLMKVYRLLKKIVFFTFMKQKGKI